MKIEIILLVFMYAFFSILYIFDLVDMGFYLGTIIYVGFITIALILKGDGNEL